MIGHSTPARIERAFQLLFARPPSDDEQAIVRDYLAHLPDALQSWKSVTRALWLSNELMYVD